MQRTSILLPTSSARLWAIHPHKSVPSNGFRHPILQLHFKKNPGEALSPKKDFFLVIFILCPSGSQGFT